MNIDDDVRMTASADAWNRPMPADEPPASDPPRQSAVGSPNRSLAPTLALAGDADDNRRLRDFADASSEWFWECDADLRFVWFSEHASERLGLPFGKLLGRTRLEIANSSNEAAWQQHIADLMARRPFRDFRYQMAAAEGGAWLSVSGVPVHDATGRFLGYRGTGRNVTVEVEAARRVREAELRLRVAFESSFNGIGISRLSDGRLLEVNGAMARMLGYDAQEVVGRTSVELGLWRSEEDRSRDLRELVANGVMHWDIDGFLCADGTPLSARLTARPFSMDGEQHLLITIDDQTNARRTEFEMRKLSRAVDQVSAAIFITNADGVIEYINQGFSRLTGYDACEALGRTPRMLSSGLMLAEEYETLWSTIRSGSNYSGDICNRRKDGSLYWANLTISPAQDAERHSTHYIAIQTDVTDARRMILELQASEERFRTLVESSLLGICIVREDVPLFVNQSFADVFGFASTDEIIALGSCASLWSGGDHGRLLELAGCDERESGAASHELRGLRKDGSEVHLLVQVRNIPWNGEAATQVSVVDITLRKRFEARLEFQANYDALTGLPNRSLALDRLTTVIRSARRRRSTVGLLFIDFDRFKQINDRFGHAAGDDFLVAAARRIVDVIREEDTVARLGGDEFVVILPNVRGLADVELVAQRIVEQMAAPFVLGGQEVYSGASIGLATCPEHGLDAESLLRHADAAMYAAKTSRGGFRVYSQAFSERSQTRLRLESELRRAQERGQLSVVYQPLLAVDTGRLVGAEALLRWHHLELGQISPNDFIRIAEETGLIVPIGDWVLQQACIDARAWADHGHAGVGLSVNVSSRQFRGGALLDSVRGALAAGRIDPTKLELEITESLLIENIEETAAMLRALESIGVRLAIDDFGTGYSSLTYLNRFPIDTLKIDRSFIAGMIDDRMQATLVDALIAMAQRLRLRVIAEGVEQFAQFDLLATRGCDVVQGYLVSRPLPLPEFIRLLDEWRPEKMVLAGHGATKVLRQARRVCQEVCSDCSPQLPAPCPQIAAAQCATDRTRGAPSR